MGSNFACLLVGCLFQQLHNLLAVDERLSVEGDPPALYSDAVLAEGGVLESPPMAAAGAIEQPRGLRVKEGHDMLYFKTNNRTTATHHVAADNLGLVELVQVHLAVDAHEVDGVDDGHVLRGAEVPGQPVRRDELEVARVDLEAHQGADVPHPLAQLNVLLKLFPLQRQ